MSKIASSEPCEFHSDFVSPLCGTEGLMIKGEPMEPISHTRSVDAFLVCMRVHV